MISVSCFAERAVASRPPPPRVSALLLASRAPVVQNNSEGQSARAAQSVVLRQSGRPRCLRIPSKRFMQRLLASVVGAFIAFGCKSHAHDAVQGSKLLTQVQTIPLDAVEGRIDHFGLVC